MSTENKNKGSNGEIRPAHLDSKDIRKELIELYDQGPSEEDLKKIEQIQLEKGVDKYGFIKTKPISNTEASSIESLRNKQTQWLKILRKWEQYYPSKPLKKCVYNGVPDSMRGEVWKRILEVPHETKSNPGHYEHLKVIAKERSTDLRQIDLDINRTYRSHLIFNPRYSIKQKALFYVLGAYAEHNKDVGYCQGMANVAALLLMYMNEDDAFWALSTLLTGKKYSMHGFFVSGFPKLLRFQIHHEKIFKKLLPKLYAHFESQNIGSTLYTLKWYMQCFLDRLPFDLTLRLWDIFVLEGDKVLHPIGYTLLKLHQKELMKLDMEQIAEFLSSTLATRNYDPDSFMKLVRENISELKKHGLYPAPSVVEGELPVDSNLVFSTITEKHVSKNRVALQLLELEETGLETSFNDLLNIPAESNSIISDKSIRVSGKISLTPNAPCSTESFSRILPKVIPPPPNYPAPQPHKLSYIPGWSGKNQSTWKRNQRERIKNASRLDALNNNAQPTKSLYSESSNYFTNGAFEEEQRFSETPIVNTDTILIEGMGVSARSSINELQGATDNTNTHSSPHLPEPSNRPSKRKKKKGLLTTASMLVKSALKTPSPKHAIYTVNPGDQKVTSDTIPKTDENPTKSKGGNDKTGDNSSDTKCTSSDKASSRVSTVERSTSSDSEEQKDDDNHEIDVDNVPHISDFSYGNNVKITSTSSTSSSCSEADSPGSATSKLSNNCEDT